MFVVSICQQKLKSLYFDSQSNKLEIILPIKDVTLFWIIL